PAADRAARSRRAAPFAHARRPPDRALAADRPDVKPSRSESLLPYSVEEFITDDERRYLLAEMEKVKAAAPPGSLDAGVSGRSVHSLQGKTVKETVALFEPKGRLEVEAPRSVCEVLNDAFARRIEDIRRAYPSATWVNAWGYVEYSPGQHITPHADG